MNLPEELKKIIKGEVLTDEVSLEKASRDASVFKVRPQVVVCPKDAQDIGELVNWVIRNPGFSLTGRSGGTDMSGGVLTDSICVSFTEHFNHIIEIGKEFAVVEPGVFYRDFEKVTLEKGLLFPCFPASKNICAIGGIVNNNAGGEKTLAYGKTIRYVEEIKVVLRDGKEYGFTKMREDGLKLKMAQEDLEGEIYRAVFELLDKNYDLIQMNRPKVSKNSTGYQIWDVWDKATADNGLASKQAPLFDLSKLFVGSQGTLGMMTQVKLGLVPVRNARKLLVLNLMDLKEIPELVAKVLAKKPTAFECFDEYTVKLAVQYFPELLGIVAKHYTEAEHQFGVELLSEAQKAKLVLLVEFEGDDEVEVLQKAKGLQELVGGKIIADPVEREIWWAVRHESFNLLKSKVQGKYAAPFIDDLIVEPKFIPEFLPKLYEILNRSKMTFTIAGHIGDGNFHIFPLMDMSIAEEREEIFSVGKECFELTCKFGGSISGEHNDGLIRAPFVEMQFGNEIARIFEQIKRIFDPDGIFNPKKKLNIDEKYAKMLLMKSS